MYIASVASVAFATLAVIVALILLAILAGRYRKGSAVVGNKKPLGLTTLRVDAAEGIVDELIASFAQERGYIIDSRDPARGLVILAQPVSGVRRVAWYFSVFVSGRGPGCVVEVGAHSPLDNFLLLRPFGDPASRRESFAHFLLSYLSTKLGEGKARNVTPVPADYVKRVLSRRGFPGPELEALAIGMFGVAFATYIEGHGFETHILWPFFSAAIWWIVATTIRHNANVSDLENGGEIASYQRWMLRAVGFLLAAALAAAPSLLQTIR